MPEFDLPAGIRKLAEAERRCRRCAGRGTIPCECAFDSVPHHFDRCPDCQGSRRIVLFVALRILGHTQDCPQHYWGPAFYPSDAPCPNDFCPGYTLEPDVEKACWRIEEQHPEIVEDYMDRCIQDRGGYFVGRQEESKLWVSIRKEAVIHAALAWLEEQHA